MRGTLVLLGKDLRRCLAAPFELLIVLALPLAITGLMVLALGGLGRKPSSARITLKVVLVDLDQTLLTGMLGRPLQDPKLAERLEVQRAGTREEGLRLLYSAKASALLVLPKGLTAAATGGPPVEVELVKNPSQQGLPNVAQDGAEMLVLALSLLARNLGDEGAVVRRVLESREWPSDKQGLETLERLRVKLEGAQQYFAPPLLELADELPSAAATNRKPPQQERSIAAFFLPGMLVMGLLFVASVQMKDILRERSAGTLRRQFVAPVTATQILVAKVGASGIVVALAALLLVACGQLLFGIVWTSLAAVGVAVLATTFGAVGLAAVLYGLAGSERQGDAVGSIVVLLLLFLGGAFMPINDPPAWLASAMRLSIAYWASQAFRALGGVAAAEPLARALLVITAMGAAFLGVGVWLLRRRHVKGTL